MKDLILSTHQIIPFSDLLSLDNNVANEFVPNGLYISIDTEKKIVYSLVQEDSRIVLISFSCDADPMSRVVSQIAELPINPLTEKVVGFKYLPESETIFAATESGNLYTLSFDTSLGFNTEKFFNLIGEFEYGIKACEWSPDEEFLTIISGQNKIIILTSEYDLFFEGYPLSNKNKSSDFVSVGWGKKETQFHGKEGKLAAQKGLEPINSRLSKNEDKSTKIAWKSDGSLFSVSFYNDDERSIQVFSKEGAYVCSGETIECLEQNLAWKASGSILCSTEKLDHVYRVVFYEQNGLRHYEFPLPTYIESVDGLFWNSTSTILAIVAKTKSSSSLLPETIVQFWTSGNYHWYLKNELSESSLGGAINQLLWDSEDPYLVHILANNKTFPRSVISDTVSNCYIQLSFLSTNNVSHVAHPGSCASALVSDSNALLYTPFGISNVPPPMSLYTIDLGVSTISNRTQTCKAIGMAGFGNGNSFAVLLGDGVTISLYDVIDSVKSVVDFKKPSLLKSISIPSDLVSTKNFIPRQIVWPSKTTINLLGLSMINDFGKPEFKDSIVTINLDHNSFSISDFSILTLESLNVLSPVIRLVNNPHTNKSLITCANGEIFEIVYAPEFSLIKLHIELKDPTPYIDSIFVEKDSETEFEGQSEFEDNLLVVSLTNRNILSINNVLVTPTCTSFFLRKDYLIYTTTLHYLQFLPISKDLLLTINSTIAPVDELKRRVERGSVITLVHPVLDSVVLQMPRGNLETIKPRALVLTNIREYLKNHEFKNAFHLCRTNRVEFSIMFNYDRELFKSNIESIINQIGDIDHLCLLVSSFGLTKTSSNKPVDKGYLDNNNNDLCLAFRNKLEELDRIKYLQAITTCYVCENPQSIDSALLNIKEIGQDSFKLQSDSLSYLLYLVDQKRVYKAALGCYDLELALLVAQKGHSDPREYLTILSKLNSIKVDTNYQRYLIDTYLENFNSGIKNLTYWYLSRVKSYLKNSNIDSQQVKNTVLVDGIDDDFYFNSSVEESWNKLTSYIKKNSLYETSIYLLRPDNISETLSKAMGDEENVTIVDTVKKVAIASYSKLCSMYGHYLESNKSDFINAASAFLLADDVSNAIQCYAKSNKWSEALSLATSPKAGFTSHQVLTLAKNLAEGLISSGKSSSTNGNRYLDAAGILLDYTDSVEQGIQYLTLGQSWSEAIRNCYKFRRGDLIETIVYPNLLESHTSLLSTISENKEQFEAKINRLKELREVPLNKILSNLVPFSSNQDQADIDMMSDTASMASQFSVFTVNTTTNTTVSKANSRSTRSARTSSSRMTSKNRRKEARKKLRGRKGTIYEESYLVETINRSVIYVSDLSKGEVPNMIYALINFKHFEKANELSKSFSLLVNEVNAQLDMVFDNQRQIHTIDDVLCDEQGNPLNPDGTLASGFGQGHVDQASQYDPQTGLTNAQNKNTVGSLLPKPTKLGFEWKYKIFDE
ncbi:Elongator complex protein 1 [Smittium culicis]|uniref:Elongator complex protein 1 n=1 Tax=Smittium culicis TaxID=133412 RepID=A0A1R1XBZ6_9FUNG|nr:Elongator complex protein 1 [Smittium culicis]